MYHLGALIHRIVDSSIRMIPPTTIAWSSIQGASTFSLRISDTEAITFGITRRQVPSSQTTDFSNLTIRLGHTPGRFPTNWESTLEDLSTLSLVKTTPDSPAS